MDQIKEKIGEAAATFVQDGMVIGLGTGSTAASFIRALAKRYEEEGLNIVTVASSYQSEILARDLSVPFVSIDAISSIDITFDGADEIDPAKQLIKGAGGALLKEKILATASKELVIMVDETKCVQSLGRAKLPVEVVPFGHMLTAAKFAPFASSWQLRKRGDGRIFVTDSLHFIYDLELKLPIKDLHQLQQGLLAIAGVVETGLFLNLTGRVVTGYTDGTIKILHGS